VAFFRGTSLCPVLRLFANLTSSGAGLGVALNDDLIDTLRVA
jgi:hypothetical protein